MRTLSVSTLATACLAVVVAVAPARAAGLRVLSTDAKGVTLQVAAGNWSLSTPDADGRRVVVGVPDAHSLADPGHALLPAWATMLALPPDAHPTLRVVTASAPETRDGVKLALALKPTFKPDATGEQEPAAEVVAPVLDGAWPATPVRLGAVSAYRGRKLVSVEVRPFRYDEAAARLTVTSTLTVRLDFNRAAGASALPFAATAPDPHADDVLASAVANFEQGRAWRTAPAGMAPAPLFGARPAGAAGATEFGFDESQPEVRVQVDSTGLYLLPYELLVAKGYPAGTPVAQVSVHRHEFLEGAQVPYATIDIPCEVEDANGNGTFDAGDRIWMYAQTWAERSGASHRERWWGDAEQVFVTVNPAGGARMAQRGGWRGRTGLTPLASYPYKQHFEVNDLDPMTFVTYPADTSLDLFTWTDITFYSDRPDSITFGVNGIDTTRAVQFTVDWMGRANNTHYMWAAVKNPKDSLTTVSGGADGAYFYGKSEKVTTTTLNGSALGSGLNRFIDWGKTDYVACTPTSGCKANVGLNWFDITYWRAFDAVHDVLDFNSAGGSGEIQVHAGNFYSDSIRVYDVTVPGSPVRIVPDAAHYSGGTFDFQDSVVTGVPHHYFAAAVQDPLDPAYGPHVPPASAFARVTRRPIHTETAGDYLLIVPETFLPAVAPLVALRQSQGLHVVTATAEQVYDEFNGGRHSASAISRFIRYAYDRWSSRFVLLLGDGTLDPMNHYGRAGKDWIPCFPVPGPVPVTEGYELTVSDNAYACITGNCDPINRNEDVLPELMVGRLPANTLADAQAMVAKITAYEDYSGDQSWRLHSVLLSDDAYSSDGGFGVGNGASTYCWKDYEERFRALNEKVHSVIVDEAGLSLMDAERFNLRYYIASPSFYNDSCRVDRTTVRNYVNRAVTPVLMSHIGGSGATGTLWLNFQGHANEYVLTHEDLYVNNGDSPSSDNRYLFGNYGRPALFSAFSCHANMFARPAGAPSLYSFGGCLGEDMVTLPQRGAIASWASTCYEVVPRDDSTHLNVELARALFSNPPRDTLMASGSGVVLGEAIQAAFMRFLPKAVGYTYERGTPITYALLGDPATRITIGQPQTTVRANGVIVEDGTPVRLHTPGDSLVLVADLISTTRLDSIALLANGAPVALDSAAFAPAFPDTVNGGVSGGRHFRVTYRVTHLPPRTWRYVWSTVDHSGQRSQFTALFELAATLRSNGMVVSDGDAITPDAELKLSLVSPAPVSPLTALTVTVNGVPVPVAAGDVAAADSSGREWTITLRHASYALGNYDLAIAVAGGGTIHRSFRVTPGELRLEHVLAFPNPFDNDGTHFSFDLLGSEPATIRISVWTISGRRIWSQDWPAQQPGYHQFAWSGQDHEGSDIANGTYFYRVNAATASGHHTDTLGRMVKLRKPRHVDINSTVGP